MSKKTKTILTDVDGVLLDYSRGFIDFLNIRHPEVNLELDVWNFGLEREEVFEYLGEFNDHDDFAALPAYGDSIQFVHKLQDLGYRFIAISTCGTENCTKQNRAQNLVREFGGDVFDEIICLPLGGSKLKALSKFDPSYWIDDKLEHCVSGVMAGHTVFQMMHKYNAGENAEGATPVESWVEIYREISGF